MLHCFDILRVNSYILYHETSVQQKEIDDDQILFHKFFLTEFIDCFILRAKSVDEGERSTTRATLEDTTVVHHHTMNPPTIRISVEITHHFPNMITSVIK